MEEKKEQSLPVAGVEGEGSERYRGKLRKIAQHLAIEKSAKMREPTNTERGTGLKGTGRGKFDPPVLPPPPTSHLLLNASKYKESLNFNWSRGLVDLVETRSGIRSFIFP